MTEHYVELHASSAFSFLEAASLPETLIERAAELEMPAIALLDRNGFYGSARFHTLGRKENVRAHIGAEISVKDFGPRLTPPEWLPHKFPLSSGARQRFFRAATEDRRGKDSYPFRRVINPAKERHLRNEDDELSQKNSSR